MDETIGTEISRSGWVEGTGRKAEKLTDDPPSSCMPVPRFSAWCERHCAFPLALQEAALKGSDRCNNKGGGFTVGD